MTLDHSDSENRSSKLKMISRIFSIYFLGILVFLSIVYFVVTADKRAFRKQAIPLVHDFNMIADAALSFSYELNLPNEIKWEYKSIQTRASDLKSQISELAPPTPGMEKFTRDFLELNDLLLTYAGTQMDHAKYMKESDKVAIQMEIAQLKRRTTDDPKALDMKETALDKHNRSMTAIYQTMKDSLNEERETLYQEIKAFASEYDYFLGYGFKKFLVETKPKRKE